MRYEGLKKYLLNILFLLFFSFISASVVFHIAETKKKLVEIKKPIKKTILEKKSFINKKDFEYFLNWDPDKVNKVDVRPLSFIAIEELYNTNKLLTNILYLKKIKLSLKNEDISQLDIETLLKKMTIDNKYIKRQRDYILLKLKFEQKQNVYFVDEYEKSIDDELKQSLQQEYISGLLSINNKDKAITIFKKWYLSPVIKISKLENFFSKAKLKILFNSLSEDDWINTFVFFVNEDKQGTIKRLSRYTGSKQLRALFDAEYNYTKKKYSKTKRLLKKIKTNKLLGFKNRILYKLRLRSEKYDLVLSHADEMAKYPKAHSGFLLNAAKLTMKDRPDIAKLLFEKYLAIGNNEKKLKRRTETEISEYLGAMWKLAWLYYKNGELNKTKSLLEKTQMSEFLSYRLASEYWLAKFENKKPKAIDKHPFSYYYIAQQKREGNKLLKPVPDSFKELFLIPKTKNLNKVLINIKSLLKYGLVNDCAKYIEEEIKCSYLNTTEKNYLKFIPLIIAVREKKYGKSIWSYGRSFENYRSIQLPEYLKEIAMPIQYSDIIYKYSNIKKVDPFLVMALIKQESTFKASVVSPSKAYGLMQLLLKTANLMAKKYKKRVYRANLFMPEINIKYGVEYLKELIDKYNGNIYYALAAYNAGDHRVDNWLPFMGNVTNEEFVEMIPFKETRNYVKLVIRNYHYYRFYYGT